MSDPRHHKLDDADHKALKKVQRILEAFRTVDPRITSSYMCAFLAVALEPGKGPTHYANVLGTIQPVASRLLLEIGVKARVKDEPLGLVDRDVSPTSLRDQEYFLSTKGKALMSQLLDILKG